MKTKVSLVAITALALCVSLAQAQSCQFTSGSNTYDLSPLAGQTYPTLNTRYTAYTEYIAVCGDTVTGVSGCASDAAVCEKGTGATTGTKLAINPVTITQPGSNLVMTYTTPTGGSCYSVVITFTCDQTVDIGAPTYVSETSCIFNFAWKTKYACAGTGGGGGGGGGGDDGGGSTPGGGSSGGLSGGDVFLILFFVGGFLYIVIGMAIKYKRYDARGTDMIPNIDTWRELPSLLKDGCIFTYKSMLRLCGKE